MNKVERSYEQRTAAEHWVNSMWQANNSTSNLFNYRPSPKVG